MTDTPEPRHPLIEELRRFADREQGDIARLEAVVEVLREAEERTESRLDPDAMWVLVEQRITGDPNATDEQDG